MCAKQRKLLVIGVDQAIPALIDKYVKAGYLPNIQKMIQAGIYGEGLSSPPCDTPTNWTTIATGVSTAQHGATSFYLHIPGEPFEQSFAHRSRTQLSRFGLAPYFWDHAEAAGYTPFVINYPSGWPSSTKSGIMCSYTWPVPEAAPRMIHPSSTHQFPYTAKTTHSIQLSLSLQIPSQISPSGESSSIIVQRKAEILDVKVDGEKTLWIKSKTQENWSCLSVDTPSDWMTHEFQVLNALIPSFHCLFTVSFERLDPKDEFFTLSVSPLFNSQGWTVPSSFGRELILHNLIPEILPRKEAEYMVTAGVESYLKYAHKEVMGLGEIIKYAKQKYAWDVCFFHIHHLDTVNHKSLAYLSPAFPLKNEKKRQKAIINVRTAYQIVDELVGDLLDNVVDDDTLVVFTADHGAVPAWKVINLPRILEEAGLMTYIYNETTKEYQIDWSQTQVFPYVEPPYIWINLKGRDPHGSVLPGAFDQICDDIKHALKSAKDPETRQPLFSHVFRKEEMPELMQNGDRIGDVVYFLNPPYEIFDDNLYQLNTFTIPKRLYEKPMVYDAKRCFGAHAYYHPQTRFGGFSVTCPVIFYGKDIRKPKKLEKPFWLMDLAPTFAEYLKIPIKGSYEGKVLKDVIY